MEPAHNPPQTDLDSTVHKTHNKKAAKKTYNTRDSPVVTDLSTNLALTGLSMGERTGSRAFLWVWSYVLERCGFRRYDCHIVPGVYIQSFYPASNTMAYPT
jgi:hypothetical protein